MKRKSKGGAVDDPRFVFGIGAKVGGRYYKTGRLTGTVVGRRLDALNRPMLRVEWEDNLQSWLLQEDAIPVEELGN